MPAMDSWTLKGQLTFTETQGHLDLPATSIEEDNTPSLFIIANRFRSDQIPRFAPLSRASDNEKEVLVMVRVAHWDSNNTHFAMATSASIIQEPMTPRALTAGDLPGFTQSSLVITQAVMLGPTHDKAHRMDKGH